jgi:hypothetical protein
MSTPMRRAGEDEPIAPINLTSSVEECISRHSLPTTTKDIEIHHVYRSADGLHTHVLFWYGTPNKYLVIVLDEPGRNAVGYHFLDLAEKYGLVPPNAV